MLDESNLNDQNPRREYTGTWIPAEIMEDDNLNAIERITYAEVASFREFYASNEWLANRIGKSERTARRIIAKLVEMGYLEQAGFNGRFRTLRPCRPARNDQAGQKRPGRVAKNGQADRPEMTTIDNSKEHSIPTSSKEEGSEAPSDDQESKPKEYGNADVNALIRLFEAETGIKADPSQLNRRAAYSLIRSRGKDGAERLTKLAGDAIRSADQYAPRIGSFKDLVGKYEKASKLEAWATKQQAMRPKTIANFYAQSAPEPAEGGWEPIDKQTLAELRKRALGGLK